VILTAGFPAIVDATFLKRAERRRFKQLAEECCVPFTILDFHASEPSLRSRVEKRLAEGFDPSDADLDVLASQLQSDEPLDDEERALAIEIDSEDPKSPEQVQRRLQSWLESC